MGSARAIVRLNLAPEALDELHLSGLRPLRLDVGLVAPRSLGVTSDARIALNLEALSQFIGVFHRIYGEAFAVFDKTVHINAPKNYCRLGKV